MGSNGLLILLVVGPFFKEPLLAPSMSSVLFDYLNSFLSWFSAKTPRPFVLALAPAISSVLKLAIILGSFLAGGKP